MSIVTDGLVLNLPLDEFILKGNECYVKDMSAKGLDGQIMGALKISADSVFGRAISFDGNTENYISVKDDPSLQITGDMTVETWMTMEDTAHVDYARIIGKGKEKARNYGLWFYGGNTWLFQQRATGGDELPASSAVGKFTWQHIAAVRKGPSLYLYHNGKIINTGAVKDSSAVPVNNDPLTIGFAPHSGMHSAHKGKIAKTRIYNRALSVEEINQNIKDDLSANASSRVSHPLGFNLVNEEHEHVLYIDEINGGHPLTLEITNTSRKAITTNSFEKGVVASSVNHHFELCFKVGVLAESCLKGETPFTIADKTDWDMSAPDMNSKPGFVSFYLLGRGESKKLETNSTWKIQFKQAKADGAGGSYTTKVQLNYKQLSYEGQKNDEVTGFRSQHLSIINHQGKKIIPLHAGFIKGDAIANDGSSNNLVLRITNTQPDPILIIGNENTARRPVSKFIFSFIGLDNALSVDITKDESNSLDKIKWTVDKPKEATHPFFIAYANPAGGGIEKNGHVQFNVGNIHTLSQAGDILMRLQYENIPGFWDGEIVIPIRIAPILVKNADVNNSGHATVEIAANTKIDVRTRPDANNKHAEVLNVDETGKISALRDVDISGKLKVAQGMDVAGMNLSQSPAPNESVTSLKVGDPQYVNASFNIETKINNGIKNAFHLSANGDTELNNLKVKGELAIQPVTAPNNLATAIIQSKYENAAVNVEMHLKTQKAGEPVDAMRINEDGNVVVKGDVKAASVNTTNLNSGDITTGHLKSTGNIEGKTIIADSIKLGNWTIVAAGTALGFSNPPTTYVMVLNTNERPQLNIPGIGLYYLGQSNNWAQFQSDERLKNIQKYSMPTLEKLSRLRAIRYSWNDKGHEHHTRYHTEPKPTNHKELDAINAEQWSKAKQELHDKLDGERFGFIAQELATEFPEMVSKDEKDYLCIDYTQMVPVLTEAINEQQEIIEKLRKLFEKQQLEMETALKRLATLEGRMQEK